MLLTWVGVQAHPLLRPLPEYGVTLVDRHPVTDGLQLHSL